jgi:ATP-dependent Lon protease
MEILELPGYTFEEKVHIAQQHLVPKQLREHGLSPDSIEFSGKSLIKIIMAYTREAGVRNLERRIADVCRAIAVEVASGRIPPGAKRAIDEKDLADMLGPEKFYNETAERTEIAGVATGLAWTAAGGDLLFIEATRMPGKGTLTLTGQLGDVMKESAQTALSYLRSKADHLGIAANFLEKTDIHIHFPAGAIPKDGSGARLVALRNPGSLRRRHDRRGHPSRAGPPGGRDQGEGAGGPPSRHQAGHPSRAQREGPHRRSGAGSKGAGVRLRDPHGRRPRRGAGGEPGGEDRAHGPSARRWNQASRSPGLKATR